jgi:hypothetical protein
MNICQNCNKSFSTKYNLKRHNVICNNINTYKCEFCESIFSRKYLITSHYNKCKTKEFKEKINILEKKIDELNNKLTKYENNEFNITEEDFNTDNLTIYDILDYGNSFAIYICNNSNFLKKISIKDKKKNIIEYIIHNNKYRDKGFFLVFFIIKIFKDKIINIISDTYKNINININIDDNNEHITRIFNIKNIEINDILIKKKNKFYYEIINILIDNII